MPARTRASDHSALAAWRQKLLQVRLPAVSDADTWAELLAQSDTPEQILQSLERDLPLALAVMVEALRSPRFAAEPGGLKHAARLLGSGALGTLLHRWNAGHIEPSRTDHILLLQALADSRFAYLIQWQWLRHGQPADSEFRLWLTALFGVVRWKLALIDPAQVARIEERVAAGERRNRVEVELLGCAVEDLNVLHLQDLGFREASLWVRRCRLHPAQLAEAARCARDEDRCA